MKNIFSTFRKYQGAIAGTLALLMLVSSCTVNSHVMLKTPKDFVFDEIPSDLSQEYTITKGDKLQFRLFSNGGFKVIDMTSGKNSGANNLLRNNSTGINYVVRPDSMAKLPALGDVNIVGMNIYEAENYLEELYSEFYVEPFMQLNVVNKRVIVFPGTGSTAKVVPMQNNTVTLMELIARVGGISRDSKANTIKVVRMVDNERQIYKIDLSTIDGLEDGQMIMQANDIVYVQPNPNVARELLQDITPIVSLVTSTVLLYATFRTLKP